MLAHALASIWSLCRRPSRACWDAFARRTAVLQRLPKSSHTHTRSVPLSPVAAPRRPTPPLTWHVDAEDGGAAQALHGWLPYPWACRQGWPRRSNLRLVRHKFTVSHDVAATIPQMDSVQVLQHAFEATASYSLHPFHLPETWSRRCEARSAGAPSQNRPYYRLGISQVADS